VSLMAGTGPGFSERVPARRQCLFERRPVGLEALARVVACGVRG
jgi:hypothetical protein